MMNELNCLRCRTPMTYRGSRRLHEGARWGVLGDLGELFVNQESFKVYTCPRCGKAEFFISDPPPVPPVQVKQSTPVLSLELEPEITIVESTVIASHTDLLKLEPGKDGLEEVYDTLGYPIGSQMTEHGTVLCYSSEDEMNPHVVLVDNQAHVVRLVAVCNHLDIFTLEGLEKTYGLRELAATINGYEHWLFESKGVAFVVEGRNDHDILYVQFFEPHLSLTDYLAVEGYTVETFADGSG
jgi:hypothetical protein